LICVLRLPGHTITRCRGAGKAALGEGALYTKANPCEHLPESVGRCRPLPAKKHVGTITNSAKYTPRPNSDRRWNDGCFVQHTPEHTHRLRGEIASLQKTPRPKNRKRREPVFGAQAEERLKAPPTQLGENRPPLGAKTVRLFYVTKKSCQAHWAVSLRKPRKITLGSNTQRSSPNPPPAGPTAKQYQSLTSTFIYRTSSQAFQATSSRFATGTLFSSLLFRRAV